MELFNEGYLHEMREMAGLPPLPGAPEKEIHVLHGNASELRVRLDIATGSIVGTLGQQGFMVPRDITRAGLIEAVTKEVLTRGDVEENVRVFLASMVSEVEDLAQQLEDLLARDEVAVEKEKHLLTSMTEERAAKIIYRLIGVAKRNGYAVDMNQNADEFLASLQLEFKMNPDYFNPRDQALLGKLYEAEEEPSDAEKVGAALHKGGKYLLKKAYHIVKGLFTGGKKSSTDASGLTQAQKEAEYKRLKDKERDDAAVAKYKRERETRHAQSPGQAYPAHPGYGHPQGGYAPPPAIHYHQN